MERVELEMITARALLKNYNRIKNNLQVTAMEQESILERAEIMQCMTPEYSTYNQNIRSLKNDFELLRLQLIRLNSTIEVASFLALEKHKAAYDILQDKYLIEKPLTMKELEEKYGYKESFIYTRLQDVIKEVAELLFNYSSDEEIEQTLKIIKEICGDRHI